MMTGVFRQVEREREREGEKGATFEFRIETGVSVLARVIVPRTVCLVITNVWSWKGGLG